MPEGFESGRDHDSDISSDGQFELEEKLDILSLHASSSSGHGVSDVDDEKFVNKDATNAYARSSRVKWMHSHRRRKLQLLDQSTNSRWRPKGFRASRPSQRF